MNLTPAGGRLSPDDLEQRLREFIDRRRAVQQNADPWTRPVGEQGFDERLDDLGGIMSSAGAVLVVADSYETRILERLDLAKGYVRRRILGLVRIVQQIVRDETRGRQSPRPSVVQVEQGALHE